MRNVIAKGSGSFQKDDLQQIVEQTDVAELLLSYAPDDVKEKSGSTGTGLRCRCPFPDHDDRHPSFHIWTNGDFKGRFSCSCIKGTLFDFVQHIEGIDFVASLAFLKSRLPGGVVDRSFNAEKFIERIHKTLLMDEEVVYKMPQMPACERNYKLIAWYLNWKRHYDLKSAMQVIHDWGLLWCADKRYLFKTETNPNGICFHNSIIIPMADASGSTVMWQSQFADGRQGKNKLFPPDGWNPNVLPGMSRCIQKGFRWALLVEGYWDLAKSWHRGTPAIASTTAWLNEHQARAIFEHLDLVVTAYDNDDAGREAAKRVQTALGNVIDIRHLNVPHKLKLGRKLDIDSMTDEEMAYYLEHQAESVDQLE